MQENRSVWPKTMILEHRKTSGNPYSGRNRKLKLVTANGEFIAAEAERTLMNSEGNGQVCKLTIASLVFLSG